MTAAVLWSGGKDCFGAGLRSGALEEQGTRLVTFVPTGEAAAFRCHPLGVMARQAAMLGLAHERIAIERDAWEASYRAAFAQMASEGVERVVTGDITPEAWPWLGEATAVAGLDLATPLAVEPDPLALLDWLDDAGVVATVSGMRADCYRPGFLGRPIGRALLCEHGLDDLEAFHPCGERGEFHTIVTTFGGMRFLAEDPAAVAHLERDGIWALDFQRANRPEPPHPPDSPPARR